ncbi:hypothetical protein K2173_013183 [Erythroxylum novogranatense]|uniref:Integrase catalytic domain-containing protein n=1 Tax=Erythroxylum novogranatense TaxID=1862640 RepID=A0AAV8TGM9_9ROSI|nr:hypothetical protein K2173_013183 [Erythroxylum novogranatense]
MAFFPHSSSSSFPSNTSINSSSSISIKLNSTNYLAWKTQFGPILNFQDLHGFIDGTTPSPSKTIPISDTNPTPKPNPEFVEWFKKDQLLQSWLLASLTEEVYPLVIGLNYSFEVWQALSNAFGAIFMNRQLQLHIELQELRKNDLSVSAYLQKAKFLADQLSAAGRPLSTAEFNAIIYRNLVSFYELHGHLAPHELLLKNLHQPMTNLSLTSNAPLLPTPTSNAPLLPTPTSRPQSSTPFTNQDNFNRRVTCQICGKPNHSALTCRRRYNRDNNGSNTSAHSSYAPRVTPKYPLGGYMDATQDDSMQGPSEDGAITTVAPSMDDWHRRLGHSNISKLSALLKQNKISVSDSSLTPCSSCHLGKLSRVSLASKEHTSSKPFDIIFPIMGHRYFVIFVDDFTRFTWIYFMKAKSEVFNIFLQFEQLIKRQFSKNILAFHSDWGGEYQRLHQYFRKNGINHRIACLYTHEQNGTAERKIRHLVDTGLTLLAHAHLPLKYWNYALEQSAMIINILPSDVLHKISPFFKLFSKDPNYLSIHSFGCSVFPLLRPYNNHKFNFRTTECVYLGQSPFHSAYRCLDSKTGRVYLAKHVRFHTQTFPYANRPTISSLEPQADPTWLTVTCTLPASHGPSSGTSFSSTSTPSPSPFLSNTPMQSSSSPQSSPTKTNLSPTNSSSHHSLSPSSTDLQLTVDLSSYPNDLRPEPHLRPPIPIPNHSNTSQPPPPDTLNPPQTAPTLTRTHSMKLRPNPPRKHVFAATTSPTQEPKTFI